MTSHFRSTTPARPALCEGCGAAIAWARSEGGRPMPFDITPAQAGKWAIDAGVARYLGANASGGFVPHWSTCPDAGRFRKGRRP